MSATELNSAAAAAQLLELLNDLPGIGATQIGAPESIGPQVSAWIGMGGQRIARKATGLTQREARYFVCFCYRVDAAEASAETALMDLVDSFLVALHEDLTLKGTCLSLGVNSAAADEPDYQLRAGKEYREYPMIVEVRQQGSYRIAD